MVYQLSYTASILESFGILSGFPVAEAIWRTYAAFAIPKISESTVRLRGALFYLKDLTPEQAGEELSTIAPCMPLLFNLRTDIEEMDNPDFKQAALDFFDTVNLLFSIFRTSLPFMLPTNYLCPYWPSIGAGRKMTTGILIEPV